MSKTGLKDRITQPLYDTMQLAAVAGPQTVDFFSVAYGGILVGTTKKGYQHTNVKQIGQLEKGNSYIITGLSAYIREDATAPVSRVDANLIQSGHMQLVFGDQRNKLRLPMHMIPSGGADLNYSSNIAAAVTEFSINRGASVSANIFRLTQPIEIDDQELFGIEFTVPGTIVAVTQLTFVLHGELTRNVG